MKSGLLGRKLGHSYSPQIHALMGEYSYELFEREPDEVADFIKHGDFTGNVWCIDKNTTNPYRLSQTLGEKARTAEGLQLLRQEGQLVPIQSAVLTSNPLLSLQLTANSVFLIETTPIN